jgi:hypothetical protein
VHRNNADKGSSALALRFGQALHFASRLGIDETATAPWDLESLGINGNWGWQKAALLPHQRKFEVQTTQAASAEFFHTPLHK